MPCAPSGATASKSLPEDKFLAEVGRVFMPGTPLMLRDLGLAAYLPVLLPELPGAPEFPDEAALIAYVSRDRYAAARNDSVIGRMYTHTHLFVFDMATSGAHFAEPLDAPADTPVRAFFCTGADADWQADGDVVVWAGHRPTGGLPDALGGALGSAAATFGGAGVRECIGEVADTWAVLWFLLDGFHGAGADAVVAPLVTDLAGATQILLTTASRLVWLDEPPPVPAARGGAWTYVFERDARHFFR